MSIGTPSGDPDGQEGQERVPIATLAEAIARVVAIMPQEIQQRYLVGEIWEEIWRFLNVPIDHFMNTNLGPKRAKIFLAAYLVNFVVQGLLMELALEQKVDPITKDLEYLDEMDRRDITETSQKILYFSRYELGVQIDIVNGMPLVAI